MPLSILSIFQQHKEGKELPEDQEWKSLLLLRGIPSWHQWAWSQKTLEDDSKYQTIFFQAEVIVSLSLATFFLVFISTFLSFLFIYHIISYHNLLPSCFSAFSPISLSSACFQFSLRRPVSSPHCSPAVLCTSHLKDFFLRRLMCQPKYLKWLTYTKLLYSLCLTDSYIANSRILNRLLSSQDHI